VEIAAGMASRAAAASRAWYADTPPTSSCSSSDFSPSRMEEYSSPRSKRTCALSFTCIQTTPRRARRRQSRLGSLAVSCQLHNGIPCLFKTAAHCHTLPRALSNTAALPHTAARIATDCCSHCCTLCRTVAHCRTHCRRLPHCCTLPHTAAHCRVHCNTLESNYSSIIIELYSEL
jgi:hypothetical protein